MKYMLDTNICIFIMKKSSEILKRKFSGISEDAVCISSLTFAELMHGIEKSERKAKNMRVLLAFLKNIPIISFDSSAAAMYGNVMARLELKGNKIGPIDTLIAGHALSENLTLVTNNTREFERVEGLKVEDWTK